MKTLGFLLLGFSAAAAAVAQTAETPRAGDEYHGTLFGQRIDVPARDRRSVNAVTLDLLGVPDGPEDHRVSPMGGLFLWRNRSDGREVLRAQIAVVSNDVRYSRALSAGGIEAVATWENTTLPWSSSESIEGMRDAAGELKPRSVRAGVGAGYRAALAPGLQDNFFEASLAYEPGYLFFARGADTAAGFILPRDTYEGRLHLRVRADAFERNLLELPHRGWGAGLDGRIGRRTTWSDWGGDAFGIERGAEARAWSSLSAYGILAAGVPGVPGERHRLVLSAYGGIGSHLDRFSAPRLDGFSNAGDWESLARPVLAAAASDEFFPSHYELVDLEYRYQALFFLFLQARGTLAWLDRPRTAADGRVSDRTEFLPGVTAAITSGMVWDLSFEIGWSHNFGVLRRSNGRAQKGGDALFLALTKLFLPPR